MSQSNANVSEIIGADLRLIWVLRILTTYIECFV